MLAKFPTEIINLILDEIPNRRDLKKLCEVSRSYYRIVIPKLYETVVIMKSPSAEFLNLEPLTCHRSTHCLQFVKNLKFSLGYVVEDSAECIHCPSILEQGDELSNYYHSGVEALAVFISPVLSLLERFEDHQLLSFSWDLEMCLPSQIVGADGFLAKKQNRLQSLSLVTDPSCPHPNEDAMDLTAFRDLRNFSWKKIRTDNLEALNSWFESNLDLIQTLELDFSDMRDDRNDMAWSDFLYSDALKLNTGDKNLKFLSLESLTLSQVAFKPGSVEVARFFNFSGLRTLRLRVCSETNCLLQTVVQSNIPIKLKTFELVSCLGDDFAVESIPAVKPFLESFTGLQNLYIDLDYTFEEYRTYLHTIAKHGPTMKRLAFEQSALDLDLLCQMTFCCTEPGFLGALYDTVEPLLNSILSNGKFECLGFHDSFILLKPLLTPPMRKSLKVLHLRKYGDCLSDPASPDSDVKKRKLSLYEEMANNNQPFNPKSEGEESDNEANKTLQPDHLPRPENGFRRSMDELRATRDLRMEKRGQCVRNWENYKRRLLEFAQWAFGPNGFPNLRFIVYGDLSTDDLTKASIVLCRKPLAEPVGEEDEKQQQQQHEPRFKLLGDWDTEWMDLMHNYSDFLSSIPPGSLDSAFSVDDYLD